MNATQTKIIEMLESLPEEALDEVKVFLDFVSWRYQRSVRNPQALSRGEAMVAAMVGKGTSGLTTDEIMQMTRGEE
ncbi:transcriptional regulator [[Limnothrix rosea] IAM M-220]|uniref:transcriptional regulator n=1 Tax=[Limnothrix rosea] IAM M-220 TaxID=454133 RepID=UPI000965209A|nr:transcriptional regulator [[Limnothrix rosea] IAM M-220]OKH17069.1 transcriptional regulator [[Limnothrix rosea] IAM M-220]